MFVIGITGPIGSGKSTIGKFFRKKGLEVLDADALSREVSGVKGEALKEIEECFGSDFVSEKEGLLRKKMAAHVFSNKKALDQLSLIIHKYVIEKVKERVEEARKEKKASIVLDFPLPVKEGFLDLVDFVLVPHTPLETRFHRLQARGLSEISAKQRMAVQMNPEQYEQFASLILDNGKDEAYLEKQLENFWEKEMRGRGII